MKRQGTAQFHGSHPGADQQDSIGDPFTDGEQKRQALTQRLAQPLATHGQASGNHQLDQHLAA